MGLGFMHCQTKHISSLFFCHVVVCLFLSACGGGDGGGGGGGINAAFRANNYCNARGDVPATFETQEYYESLGLSQIKAAAAYERGAEGCGVTIAVVDSGVYVRNTAGEVILHKELQGEGKVIPQQEEHNFHQGDRTQTFPSGISQIPATDGFSHATTVATTAAGKRDGEGTHGVAPGATILNYAIRAGSGDPGPLVPITVEQLGMAVSEDATTISDILSTGASVINASFGYTGLVDTYDTAEVRTATRPLWETLAQSNRDAADRTVTIVASGNDHGATLQDGSTLDATSPDILPGLAHHVPEIRGHFLTVSAVGTDGAIADYSNRCGVAQSFCLVAPGTAGRMETVGANTYQQQAAVITHEGEGFDNTVAGTSFAAPLVSGAFAVLKSAFPTMGNQELVTRLLTTADKTGVYADANIYGQGLLDLDAATNPVGTMTLRFGDSVYNARAYAAAEAFTLPPVFGDALGALSARQVTAHDALNTPFAVSFGQTWRPHVDYWWEQQWISATRHRLHRSSFPSGNGYTVSYADWDGTGRYSGLSWHSTDEPEGSLWLSFGAGAAPWWNGPEATSSSYLGREEFFNPYLSMADHGVSAGRAWRLAGGWRGGVSVYANTPRHDDVAEAIKQSTVAWQADLLYNGSLPVADEHSSDWQVGLQGGHLLEQNRWLSGEGVGALDVTGAQTSFAGVSLEQRTQHWAWRVAAYQGWTSTTTGGRGLLEGTEGLRSRSWVAGLDRLHVWRPGDRLGLQVYEPMRVEGGRLRLRLPTGRDRYGQLNYETVGVSGAPSGRTRDISIGYSSAAGADDGSQSRWSLRQGARLETGQDALAKPQWYALASWQLDF